MRAIETYTSEQMNSTEKLVQIIATIPDSKKVVAVVAVNAYLDGFMAGNGLETEMKLNSDQLCK